ncbi:hypothetical protein BH09ACT13_BH09ACT13_05800 [soil metagenome]
MSASATQGVGGAPRQRRAARLVRWWRRYWWLIASAVGLGAFVLAFVGTEGGILARLHGAVLLLPLGTSTDVAGNSTLVQIARIIAPVVFAYVTYRALFVLVGERVQGARASVKRNHTVVYGLGSQGQALVESLLEGRKVVAVELDPTNVAVRRLRDAGAVVLIGDATDPELARKANVGHARYVVSTCGQDAVNAQVGANLLLQSRAQDKPLDVFIHLADPRLYAFLVHRSLPKPDLRLEFFNIYERGARSLVEEAALAGRPQPQTVLVVGAGQLGMALISLIARDRNELLTSNASEGKVRIHVVDREARSRVQQLADRYSRLRDACDVEPHEIDVESPAFDHLLDRESWMGEVDVGFVCFDGDSLTISSTLNLLNQARDRFPVVARVTHRSKGIAGLIDGAAAAVFRPLSITQQACQADLVLEGIRGQLALQVHRLYREQQGGRYDVPWEDLSEEGRERNLRHADDISHQLGAVGYRLGPLIDWGQPLPVLGPDEVERMAAMEHERWVKERLADGWHFGPVRDDDLKIHPDVVPWRELAEAQREINRRLIRARPAMLARVGVQIYVADVQEMLAQALHEAYIEQRLGAGERLGSTPSLTSWSELPVEFKVSSRRNAADISSAVATLGYNVRPASGRNSSLALSTDEVDVLAERVHERWVDERETGGWRVGAQRDDAQRIHPDLVPWDDLPDERREIDRQLLRKLPEVLEQVGLVLDRAG